MFESYILEALYTSIFQLTGMFVWILFIGWIVLSFLYMFVYQGIGSSYSYHAWYWRTTNPKLRCSRTALVWSFIVHCFTMFNYSHRADRFGYLAVNGGGVWRGIGDYADSAKARTPAQTKLASAYTDSHAALNAAQ